MVREVLTRLDHVPDDLGLLLVAADETLAQRVCGLVAPLGYRYRTSCDSWPEPKRRRGHSGVLALCAASGVTDGLALLRQLSAQEGARSICVLTEDAAAETGAALLNAGADLWLPIQMAPHLVRAFVLAAARRLVSLPPATLNARAHTVSLRDWTARLTQTEFKVFDYLCTHSHRWVPAPELRALALNKGYHSSDSLVRVYIRGIRRALGPHHECLRSTRQLGYRIVFEDGDDHVGPGLMDQRGSATPWRRLCDG